MKIDKSLRSTEYLYLPWRYMPVGRQKEVKDEKKIFEEGRLTHLKLTFYFDVAMSFAMLPQEKRVKRKREDADANANADGGVRQQRGAR